MVKLRGKQTGGFFTTLPEGKEWHWPWVVISCYFGGFPSNLYLPLVWLHLEQWFSAWVCRKITWRAWQIGCWTPCLCMWMPQALHQFLLCLPWTPRLRLKAWRWASGWHSIPLGGCLRKEGHVGLEWGLRAIHEGNLWVPAPKVGPRKWVTWPLHGQRIPKTPQQLGGRQPEGQHRISQLCCWKCMPTQQQQHHSEACQKFRISGLTPNLLNQDQHLSKVPWTSVSTRSLSSTGLSLRPGPGPFPWVWGQDLSWRMRMML